MSKNQNWILPACDSFPLIVSQMRTKIIFILVCFYLQNKLPSQGIRTLCKSMPCARGRSRKCKKGGRDPKGRPGGWYNPKIAQKWPKIGWICMIYLSKGGLVPIRTLRGSAPAMRDGTHECTVYTRGVTLHWLAMHPRTQKV